MDTKTITTVIIDGKRLYNFDSLILKQRIREHHEFEIIIDQEISDKAGSHTIEESRDWLNKSAVISMDQKDFMGIITNINLHHADGFNGKIVVKGYSKTILLESGIYSKSWNNKPISYIVNETLRNTQKLDFLAKPENDFMLTYESQYQESYFSFLIRLSVYRGEWFFYDGLRVVFGKPPVESALDIFYGESITELSIGMDISTHSPSLYSYDAMEDTISITKPKDDIAGLNELAAYAYTLSKEIYPNIPTAESPTPIYNKFELDQAVRKTQSAESVRLNTIRGKSSDKRLGVGVIINIRSAKYDNKTFEEKPYGVYIITAITHNAAGNHKYQNEFEAVPGDTRVLPLSKIKRPKALSQLATVISNKDPLRKGRIQVRYFWQTNNMQSDWLRVMSLNAGGSDQKPTNRGLVFIPEIGDQVVVNFLQNDPNQGYVAGSLFTGKTGAGGKDENAFKSISSRSGGILEFNDTKGSESIKMTDKKENLIFMDTVNGAIVITSPKSITVKSKEINIIAEDKVHIESKEVTIIGTDKIKEKSDSSIEVESPKITSSSDATSINAKQTIDIEAKQITNVKGTTAVNLN